MICGPRKVYLAKKVGKLLKATSTSSSEPSCHLPRTTTLTFLRGNFLSLIKLTDESLISLRQPSCFASSSNTTASIGKVQDSSGLIFLPGFLSGIGCWSSFVHLVCSSSSFFQADASAESSQRRSEGDIEFTWNEVSGDLPATCQLPVSVTLFPTAVPNFWSPFTCIATGC